MNEGQLVTLPNSVLRQKSQKIKDINKEIFDLVTAMKNITLNWEKNRQHEVGVALAAVQAGQLYRLVIVRKNPDNKQNQDFEVLINPEITKYEGRVETDFEGCLSIKDVYGKVPRYTKVRVKATNLNGQVFRVKAEGFLARILQHEIDHTDGKLFIDYIRNKPSAFYRLGAEGHLDKIDYEKTIKHNKVLW